MTKIKVKAIRRLRGRIRVPGDKSISHRAIMLGSLARGTTEISGISNGQDCIKTAQAFQKMGIKIEGLDTQYLVIHGRGLSGLAMPKEILDVGNSGTTMRLLTGILAGQNFSCSITGDKYLRTRPMGRIIEPLSRMGARISGRKGNLAPLEIAGQALSAISYHSSIPSAQVKSSILLASLYASSQTMVSEPVKSRDHTERMLKYLGADIQLDGLKVTIQGRKELMARKIRVPGDISSAAFFIGACLIIPGSDITISNVGVNPTRMGAVKVLRDMGAQIEVKNPREDNLEPYGDIWVRTSKLRSINIGGDIVPSLIDEIPVLAVVATQASQKTTIRDARELRVKETDRIKALVTNLAKMGAEIEELNDGIVINGPRRLRGAEVSSFWDHRIAMAMVVAGLIAEGETTVFNTECINTSFPEFMETLNRLIDS